MTSHSNGGWPTGYRINPRVGIADAQLVDAFRTVPTAHASDCMGRSVGAIGLNAYHGLGIMCGVAITVRVRPGDNLMIHKAMEMAQAGDVIVVDGSGDNTQALIGGLMRTTAIKKGLGGYVLDGAVRDIVEFADGQMPCYARSAVHRGPSKDGPGEINIPISCAGMVVNPGDLMLGDADGVIAIPAAELSALLPLVRAHADKENRMRAAILGGKTDPDRFNAILRAKGISAELLAAAQ